MIFLHDPFPCLLNTHGYLCQNVTWTIEEKQKQSKERKQAIAEIKGGLATLKKRERNKKRTGRRKKSVNRLRRKTRINLMVQHAARKLGIKI